MTWRLYTGQVHYVATNSYFSKGDQSLKCQDSAHKSWTVLTHTTIHTVRTMVEGRLRTDNRTQTLSSHTMRHGLHISIMFVNTTQT